MDKLICHDCGNEIEYDDAVIISDEEIYCEYCYSENYKPCRQCKEDTFVGDLRYGICISCLIKMRYAGID